MSVLSSRICRLFNLTVLVQTTLRIKSTVCNMPEHLTQGSSEPSLVPGKLRLYGMRFCPYDHRAHLVLLSKDIPHDNVFINLTTKPDWYVKRVPSTKVPGLVVDGGEVLYESLIIADFLDEQFPQRPLHRSNPLLKAKDKILIENFAKVTSAFFKVIMNKEGPSVEDFDRLLSELETYNEELANRSTKFFGGLEPGMVDYMIWPWFERLPCLKVLFGNHFDLPKGKLTNLVSWMELMLQDNAVKQYRISVDAHAQFMRSFATGAPDFNIPV